MNKDYPRISFKKSWAGIANLILTQKMNDYQRQSSNVSEKSFSENISLIDQNDYMKSSVLSLISLKSKENNNQVKRESYRNLMRKIQSPKAQKTSIAPQKMKYNRPTRKSLYHNFQYKGKQTENQQDEQIRRQSCDCNECGKKSTKQKKLNLKKQFMEVQMHHREKLAEIILSNLRRQSSVLQGTKGSDKGNLRKFITSHKQSMIIFQNKYGDQLQNNLSVHGSTDNALIELNDQLSKLKNYQHLLEENDQILENNDKRKTIFTKKHIKHIQDHGNIVGSSKLIRGQSENVSSQEDSRECKLRRLHDSNGNKKSGIQERFHYLLMNKNKTSTIMNYVTSHSSLLSLQNSSSNKQQFQSAKNIFIKNKSIPKNQMENTMKIYVKSEYQHRLNLQNQRIKTRNNSNMLPKLMLFKK